MMINYPDKLVYLQNIMARAKHLASLPASNVDIRSIDDSIKHLTDPPEYLKEMLDIYSRNSAADVRKEFIRVMKMMNEKCPIVSIRDEFLAVMKSLKSRCPVISPLIEDKRVADSEQMWFTSLWSKLFGLVHGSSSMGYGGITGALVTSFSGLVQVKAAAPEVCKQLLFQPEASKYVTFASLSLLMTVVLKPIMNHDVQNFPEKIKLPHYSTYETYHDAIRARRQANDKFREEDTKFILSSSDGISIDVLMAVMGILSTAGGATAHAIQFAARAIPKNAIRRIVRSMMAPITLGLGIAALGGSLVAYDKMDKLVNGGYTSISAGPGGSKVETLDEIVDAFMETLSYDDHRSGTKDKKPGLGQIPSRFKKKDTSEGD
jgi:hypothetical protein